MNTEPYSLFGYWNDKGEHVEVNSAPPTPDEARPFHLVIRSSGVIPLSILVFARDAAHAEYRVREALRECAENSRSGYGPHRAVAILSQLASGEMLLTVEPMDVAGIYARVNWASNGGL